MDKKEKQIKKLCHEIGKITFKEIISNIDRNAIGNKIREISDLRVEHERENIIKKLKANKILKQHIRNAGNCQRKSEKAPDNCWCMRCVRQSSYNLFIEEVENLK